MPCLKQRIRSMRADEARATCYKNPFRFQVGLNSYPKFVTTISK
jgi:hypothetical protein